MDGGRSGQVSIDVTDTFNDLIIIWSSWNQFICHWSSQFEQVIKMAQLLIAPKPSWTCSKEKKSFCDCWRSLGLCIPLTATSATFFCGGGSNSKFEGSSHVQLWLQDSSGRYQCGNIGQIHLHNSSNRQAAVQGVSAYRLRQFWALFDIIVDLN